MKELRLLEPTTFFENQLGEKMMHPDGRPLLEPRPTSLQAGVVSSAQGSAMAKQGDTTVLAVVKAELATPRPEKPGLGFLLPSLEFAGGSGGGSKGDTKVKDILCEMAKGGELLDLSTLCLHSGKFVWALTLDWLCLDNDGGLLDTALLAAAAALADTQLPHVELVDELAESDISLSISRSDKRRKLVPRLNSSKALSPLQLPAPSLSLSFSCHDPQKGNEPLSLLCDPDKDTLAFLEGRMLVVVSQGSDADSPLAGAHSFGPNCSQLLLEPAIKQCVKLSRWRHAQLT